VIEAPALALRLVLIAALGLGAYLLLASLSLWLLGGSETIESVLYLGAFAVVLPAAVVGGTSLADRLNRSGTLEPVTLGIATMLVLLLVAARGVYALTGEATVGTPGFLAALAGWAAAGTVLVRVVGDGGREAVPAWLRSGKRSPRVALALLCLALVLAFPPSRVLAPAELVAGLALAGVLLGAYLLLRQLRPGRRWGLALDLAAIAVLLVLANDTQLYADPDQFYVIDGHLHENFYLGPTNDVVHGRPMLVDTFSQYGVVLIYALAAWSKVASLGYGAMTLLSAMLAAAEIAAVYGILRLARATRPLAFAAGAVAGLALFFAGSLPAPTSHPSLGGVRYLLPYLVVLAGVAGARFPRRIEQWWWVAAMLVGLSSVWSVETFGYSAAAFTGMVAYRAALDVAPWTAAIRALVPGLVAIVVAQIGFAALTLSLAGSLPDWGGYLAFLGSYSVDGISSVPIEPWSPSLVIAGGYVASIAGFVLLVRARAAITREERATLLAIAGMVPFGAVSFTYYVGNSFPDGALLVGLPCCVTAALWLTLIERRPWQIPRAARTGALALTTWFVALGFVFAWPTIEQRAGDTPLAMALPDSGSGGSLTNELARMWRSDPLDGRFDAAKALAQEYFPGDGPIPTAATTENTVTVLMETGRVNAFPVSHYLQEGLVLDRSWPRVRRTVDGLGPGSLILVERDALDGKYPAPLLTRTVTELQRRFRLEVVAGDPNGFFVARLVSRAG